MPIVRESDFSVGNGYLYGNSARQITRWNASLHNIYVHPDQPYDFEAQERCRERTQSFTNPCVFTISSLFLSLALTSLFFPILEASKYKVISSFFTFIFGGLSLSVLWSIYKNPASNAPCITACSNGMSEKNKRRVSAAVGFTWLLPFLLSSFILILVSKVLVEFYNRDPSSLASREEYEKLQNQKFEWLQGSIYIISWVLHSGIHLQRHARDMIKTVKEIKDLCCKPFQYLRASHEENTQNTREFTVNNDEPSTSCSINNNLSNNVNTLPNSQPTINSTETEILIHNPPSSKIDTSLNNVSTLPNSETTSIAIEMPLPSSSKASI